MALPQKAARTLHRIAIATGLGTSAALVIDNAHRRQKSHSEDRTDRPARVAAAGELTFPAVNTVSCDQQVTNRMPRRTRATTMSRMENTSTKANVNESFTVEWDHPLGEGGFGAVLLGTDKRTGETVAVKKISKEVSDDASFQREINALLHIRHKGGHPNICGLHENYNEGDFYYLVLDLVAGGEMFDHLISNGWYSEADAARLLREIGSALAFLHGIDIVHGDLKPENLMLSSENASEAVIKVVDFGCAQVLDATSPFFEGRSFIFANTPGYTPPEVLDRSSGVSKLDQSVDMFAIGVILFIMLTGVHPFDPLGTASDEELDQRIESKEWPSIRDSHMAAHLSNSAIDVIERLMERDPKRRLTAQQMLDHPWVRGETARTGKIADSDKRLSTYRKYKSRLEAKVFQSMVEWSDESSGSDIARKTSLIERSFHMLDPENKGYIASRDVEELGDSGAGSARGDDDEELSLSGFSDLLSENMKNRYYPAGHVVYEEGEAGTKMYFVNSGRVQISTKDGFTTNTEQGGFFGEGALLSSSGIRSATITCLTPVHAIEISKEYFEKYLAAGYGTELNLKEKDKIRQNERARGILASTKSLTGVLLGKGEYLYKQGEPGNDLFILEEGEAEVAVDDHVVFAVQPGELCGEHALVFGKKRNTSAKCISDQCKVQVMKADDFRKISSSRSTVRDCLRDTALRREFQKALVYETKRAFPTGEEELRQAFFAADVNKSGEIDLAAVKTMLRKMDSTFSENDIHDIMDSLDLDGSGAVDWEEFKRIFAINGDRA